MKGIKAILFDLGSTLIYFDGQWPKVIDQGYANLVNALKDEGIYLNGGNFINQFRQRLERYYIEREVDYVEHTTFYFLIKMLARWGYENVEEAVIRRALAAMYGASQAYWNVENDTISTLQVLHEQGYQLGLISNAADDDDVQRLVDNAGIRSCFEIILTSAGQGIRKPDRRIFQTALDHLGYQPAQAVMVGDTLAADILGAQNAGIFSIWITRRADTPPNQAYQGVITPDAEIKALSELPDLLENHSGK